MSLSLSLSLKMRLNCATKDMSGEHSISYQLEAVSGEENKPWSKYTPAGSLRFTVTNEAAPELEPGEYIVTLTKVVEQEDPAASADEQEDAPPSAEA